MSAILPLPETTTLPDFQLPKTSGNTSILRPSFLPVPGQKDACYKMSLILVEWIDANLERVHFRNRAGELLVTLDQVVAAILDNNLLELAGEETYA